MDPTLDPTNGHLDVLTTRTDPIHLALHPKSKTSPCMQSRSKPDEIDTSLHRSEVLTQSHKTTTINDLQKKHDNLHPSNTNSHTSSAPENPMLATSKRTYIARPSLH